MQPVASFEAIHLNGTISQAALHGAVTETMIGTNAPTRIHILPVTALSDPFLASPESESTDETTGRYG